MAQTKADVLKKAGEVEASLKGKLFLSGARPTAADVKLFNELLGTGNTALYRWVKHMASFTEAERNAWTAPAKAAAPAKVATAAPPKAAPAPAPKAAAAPSKPADDDEVDLFGEETAEEKAALEAKKKADAAAKTTKKAAIAKSSILVDIKPWDDETNLTELATKLTSIVRDGLVWGANKLVPVAYGVKKLQQLLVIEDDKVSGEDLEDMILGMEDYVQSMDIVAWNKI